jgi:GT2 family glycosyltransferase
LDLSWRLRLAGYRLLIASDVFVLHRVHVSFQTEPLDVIEPLERSSANAFAKKLQAHYGKGNVPSQEELWGIDWFRPPDVVVWPKAA